MTTHESIPMLADRRPLDWDAERATWASYSWRCSLCGYDLGSHSAGIRACPVRRNRGEAAKTLGAEREEEFHPTRRFARRMAPSRQQQRRAALEARRVSGAATAPAMPPRPRRLPVVEWLAQWAVRRLLLTWPAPRGLLVAPVAPPQGSMGVAGGKVDI